MTRDQRQNDHVGPLFFRAYRDACQVGPTNNGKIGQVLATPHLPTGHSDKSISSFHFCLFGTSPSPRAHTWESFPSGLPRVVFHPSPNLGPTTCSTHNSPAMCVQLNRVSLVRTQTWLFCLILMYWSGQSQCDTCPCLFLGLSESAKIEEWGPCIKGDCRFIQCSF